MVPTRARSFTKALITDTDVYYTLKLGHQEDVWRHACNIGDKRSFCSECAQFNNEALDFLTEAF